MQEKTSVPNKETVEAMEESRQAAGKRYKTIEGLYEDLEAPEDLEESSQSISLDSLSPDLQKILTRAAGRNQGIGPVARGRKTLPKNFEEKRKAKRRSARAARKITRLNSK